ncbi:hypothetical protein C0991_005152 [Blastosporella zonata]|nr:hypothetical protein C0991_005152 [Blastosporella zonata]
MSSVTSSHAVHLERPERSRNAKAQARHRAKRKAYIEQLEQTVTKLQVSLGLSHDDVSVLPPPLIRIRELEQENSRLLKDNEELRRMLGETGRSSEGLRRNLQSNYQDAPRVHDRVNDYKRKKYGESEGGYMPERHATSNARAHSTTTTDDSSVNEPPIPIYVFNKSTSAFWAVCFVQPPCHINVSDAQYALGFQRHIEPPVFTVKQTLDERQSRRIPSCSLVKASLELFIPATIEGILAARELESDYKIHTNLYLVSSLIHAAACAEAGATTITVPVGRLLDWYDRGHTNAFADLSIHPGVETVQSIFQYFKLHGIKTKVIGSGFRSLSEIVPLTGLDAICISKDQADGFEGCQIDLSTTDSSPSALLRARQAQYPTNFLQSGFMDAMSPKTRVMVTSTLFTRLGEMKCEMDMFETIVEREVTRQFELRAVNLKALYRVLETSPQKSIKGKRDEIPRRSGSFED